MSGGWASETSSAVPVACITAQTIPCPPPPSVERLSSMKSVPGAKTFGDRWLEHDLDGTAFATGLFLRDPWVSWRGGSSGEGME